MKSLIFDLDQTLIDSKIAEHYRKTRQWNIVYSLIPQFVLYEGLKVVFSVIIENKIKVIIVSTSPSVYIEKVLRYHKIPYYGVIGYHDAKPIKPHPAPMLKALELLNENSINVLSFGDRAIDIQSSNKALIESVACTWGSNEKVELLQSKPTYLINNPYEIIPLIC